MARILLPNFSELLQRSYYRRKNQDIISKHILKRLFFKKKGNIKDYYLSYYCVIIYHIINIYKSKVPYCSKNQFKIFEKFFKRK